MHRWTNYLLLLLFGMGTPTFAQTLREPLEASIELLEEAERIAISGIFRNNTQAFVDYDYRLNVERRGPNGNLNSGQTDHFTAGPEQRVVLASTTINRSPEDRYIITLEIRNAEGKVILSDRYEIDGKKKSRTRKRYS